MSEDPEIEKIKQKKLEEMRPKDMLEGVLEEIYEDEMYRREMEKIKQAVRTWMTNLKCKKNPSFHHNNF